MQLITDEQRQQLLANGADENPDRDPLPVVKLFTPDANATWLLTELMPAQPDIAFGLCDLGIGFPELGYVSIAELEELRGPLSMPIERDIHFIADRTVSVYATEARHTRSILA